MWFQNCEFCKNWNFQYVNFRIKCEYLPQSVEDLCSIIVGFSDIFSSKAGSRVPACTGAMQLIEPSSVDADLASWSFVRRSSSTLQLYQFVEVNFSSKTSAKPFCGIPIIQCFKKFYFSTWRNLFWWVEWKLSEEKR